MNWYKQSNVSPGKYIMGTRGQLFPCPKKHFRDCLPYAAAQHGILVKNQNVNSNAYAEEVLRNGLVLITVGSNGFVDVKNIIGLNSEQKSAIDKIKRKFR